MDIKKFTKIAQQLSASEETIQLVALQKCNNMLQSNGMTWEILLEKITPDAQQAQKTAQNPFGFDWNFKSQRHPERPKPQERKPEYKFVRTMDIDFGPSYTLYAETVNIIEERETRYKKPMMVIGITTREGSGLEETTLHYDIIYVFDEKSIKAIKNKNPSNPLKMELTRKSKSYPPSAVVVF